MRTNYEDIISKLGEPIWYDVYGVPRYCEYKPEEGTVYPEASCYMEIACQACQKSFNVVQERDKYHAGPPMVLPEVKEGDSDSWDTVGSFHYGDPPIHGCVGDTMNSVPIKVIEFWRRLDCRWEKIERLTNYNLMPKQE